MYTVCSQVYALPMINSKKSKWWKFFIFATQNVPVIHSSFGIKGHNKLIQSSVIRLVFLTSRVASMDPKTHGLIYDQKA